MSENFTAELPAKFRRNALDLCGNAGARWLKDLPRVIEEIAEDWQLKVEQPFANLSYNYVAPCVSASGGTAVLKIALPLNDSEIFNEAKYLRTANGKGAARLLHLDESRRAILLERLMPGKNLKEIFRGSESKAVETWIRVRQSAPNSAAPNAGFRRLGEWFGNFFAKSPDTEFPLEIQNKARAFYEELSSAPAQKILLHGDLHHENILSATRADFLAIDSKGIVGEIGYEIAVFLNNHLWWLEGKPHLQEKLDDAVGRFSAAFAVPPQDLRKWAFAQMVLSAWWTFDENGTNWEKDLVLAGVWGV